MISNTNKNENMFSNNFFQLLENCTLFVSFVFLIERLLDLAKKKFDFKNIKVWKYRSSYKVLVIICMLISLYCICNHLQSEDFLKRIVLVALISVILCLKQKTKYSDVIINDCQSDTESIGAFWAHQAYDAYYEKILSTIKERMTAFEKCNSIKFPIMKLILAVPHSCDVENLLTDKDDRIKFVENLPVLECDQGANINRKLKNSVYKVELDQEVYIVAECPSPLQTLWKIQNILGKEKKIYHRDCFIKILKILLKGSPCLVLDYDDEKYKLSEYLKNILEMECLTQTLYDTSLNIL